ncbi:MAG TPA: protein kinase [Myxococcaceae bacterium]|jgi:hypothetical protein
MSSDISASFTPGAVVGGCRIEAFVAVGGFGVVYKARTANGRRVAIKIARMPAASLSNRELLLQQNEIEALIRLKHPSLVEVESYGFLDDGRMYLVTEFVEGVVLKSYLSQQGVLDALEATRLCRRIAEALAYCHDANVLHLDLKPANIIIADPFEPRIKVLDFGLARVTSGFRKRGSIARGGTVEYMAPECFTGGGDPYSARADLYALGTIFYEMLAGALPFPGGLSLGALMEAKKLGRMLPLDDVAPQLPRPVVKLVHSLLAVEPERRYSSAAALAARLKALYYDSLYGDPKSLAAPDSPAGAPEPAVTPFVGRRLELRTVRAAMDAVATGKADALAIIGEAGIGKSRLVSEALAGDMAAGMLVGYGRCRQLGELVPYSPLREALGYMATLLEDLPELRQTAGEALRGEGAALLRLVPELAHFIPRAQDQEEGPVEGALVQGMGADLVARALSHFLARLAWRRPAALVIEDMHWTDAGTLQVLKQLTTKLAPAGALLLVTARPGVPLPMGPGLAALYLDPLVPEDNQTLLSNLLGGASAESIAALKDAVPVLSTGNPLACAQIIRDLLAEGYLTREGDGQVVLSPRIRDQYQPPQSVDAVFERALDRVPASVLQVLRVAARIDRQFRASDLSALGLFQPADVQKALRIALDERLVVGAGDVHGFVHDTLREKLAGQRPVGHVQDVHRRIAHRLEERGASPGVLGYHLEQAGDDLGAAQAFLRAGLEADEMNDPTGASSHLRRAFTLLSDMPRTDARDDALVRTVHELVRVACLFGAAGDTFALLEKGDTLIARKTPAQQLALDSAYARIYFAQADFPRAAMYSERCLQTTASSDPALRKYQYVPTSVIGRAMAASGKFGPSLPVLTESYELARTAGELVEQAHTEGIMAMALGFVGQFELARNHARAAAQTGRRLGNPERIAAGHSYEAAIAEAQCRWDEGVQRTAELLAYAEEEGIFGLYLCVGTMWAGRHQFHLGRLERARLLLVNGMNLARQSGTQFGLAWASAFLGDVELVAQRYDMAHAAYMDGLALAISGVTDEYAAPLCLIGLAHVAALTGGPLQDIQRPADEALSRFADVQNETALAVARQRYAEALEIAGQEALAAPYRAKWMEHARRQDVGECDFWPRPPEGDGPWPSRREYWKDAPARHQARAARPGGDQHTSTMPSLPPKPAK